MKIFLIYFISLRNELLMESNFRSWTYVQSSSSFSIRLSNNKHA